MKKIAGKIPTPKKERKRTCRACGCTDEDCSQCVEKQGFPCHWVEADLCSCCANMAKSAARYLPGGDVAGIEESKRRALAGRKVRLFLVKHPEGATKKQISDATKCGGGILAYLRRMGFARCEQRNRREYWLPATPEGAE